VSHGMPDWGHLRKKTVYALSDMSELAVRLGSVVEYDRRGDVFYISNFNEGLGVWLGAGNVPGRIEFNQDYSKSGGISLKVFTTKTVANVWGLQAFLVPNHVTVLGLETSFTFNSDMGNIIFRIQVEDDTDIYYYWVKLDTVNKKIYTADSSSTWVEFQTGVSLMAGINVWHTLKLVIDAESKTFQRLLLDRFEYDLTAIAPYSTAIGANNQVYYGLDFYPKSTTQAEAFIDNIILTQNEPI